MELAGAGIIGGVVTTIFFGFLHQPDRVFLLAQQWVPWVTLVFVGLHIVDRRMGQGLKLLQDATTAMAGVNQMAAAQQGMATSVHDLCDVVSRRAQEDDRRAIASEAAIRFVAQQNEQILHAVGEIVRRLPA